MTAVSILVGFVAGGATGLACGLRVRHCQIRVIREQWAWSRWRNVCIQRALNRQPSYRRRLP